MASATDFLPACITEFMNLETTWSPNLASGMISRFSARWRRDIQLYLNRSLERQVRAVHGEHARTVQNLVFISAVWRRISTGAGGGLLRPAYRARRGECDSAPP